jgi:hypothetical protein
MVALLLTDHWTGCGGATLPAAGTSTKIVAVAVCRARTGSFPSRHHRHAV